MSKIKLSVVVLTKNEEKNILDCLEGLVDVSEIIIIDDFSTDRTLEVVRSLRKKNIKIFERKLDGDFSKQRNFGLSKAKSEWVLFLDADERVTHGFLSEVKEKIYKLDYNGYYVLRKDIIWGKRLMYGETGRIKLLRLGKKNAGKWKRDVQEQWIIKGKTALLNSEITHLPHQTVAEFLSEVNLYSTMRAKELKNEGAEVKMFDIILYPKAKFIVNYVVNRGFLDGLPGLVNALMMSFHSFLVRSKLYLLYNDAK